jgi:hypothetical protein
MAKLNLLVNINSYADPAPSNNPSLNLFKWCRDFSGIPVDKPQSLQFSLAPGENRTVFDGTRTLLSDGSTQFQLLLKSGTSNTYVLKHVGGTAPQFRVSRSTGADATTMVAVTKNGDVCTFASTGGTLFALIAGGVVVGDQVKIATGFQATNQGIFKVIAVTATSFAVENANGVAEGPITLGAGFADAVKIYGAAGVQVGDTVKIASVFSPATRGSYEITGVNSSEIEFYSTSALPLETVTAPGVTVYSQAKRLFYIETDKRISLTVNGAAQGNVEPIVSGTDVRPGIALRSETAWSLVVANDSLDTANIFIASVE